MSCDNGLAFNALRSVLQSECRRGGSNVEDCIFRPLCANAPVFVGGAECEKLYYGALASYYDAVAALAGRGLCSFVDGGRGAVDGVDSVVRNEGCGVAEGDALCVGGEDRSETQVVARGQRCQVTFVEREGCVADGVEPRDVGVWPAGSASVSSEAVDRGVVGSGAVMVGPAGGPSVGRGVNYARNSARRARAKVRKERVDSEVVQGFSHKRVTTQEEQDKFAREWYERKSVENKLAIKEAELRLKRYEDDEASGFDVKKVRAWQLGVEDRIRTLSGKSSSRGDSAASSLPCNSLNPPSSMTSVSERERVLEERCAELEAFKKRVEGGNVKGQGARVQLLEGKLKAATGELEDLRAAWERELKMRAGDLKYARERGF